jgi:hypothetical protein
MNKELIFLRTFAVATVLGVFALATMSFHRLGNQKFTEIDVERINIVEKDGTVKMVITNVAQFPNGNVKINGRATNADRKKRAGMLFFNEDGIECGGLIYDGQKNEKGHSSGLSLTYDQYDGDQVMQLKTIDVKEGDRRFVAGSLVFNDRPANESQAKTEAIMRELDAIRQKDPALWEQKWKEYQQLGLVGETPRIMLGKSRGMSNGLFINDDKGNPKACFYVDKNNNAKLEFFDDKGNVTASFPEKK